MKEEDVELPEWYVEWSHDAFPTLEVKVVAALAAFRTAGAMPYIHSVMKGSVFGGAMKTRGVLIIYRSMRGHWEFCLFDRVKGNELVPWHCNELASLFTNDLAATVHAGIQWLAGNQLHEVLDMIKTNTITAKQVASSSGDAVRRDHRNHS